MGSIVYSIISFIIMIITMKFTKSSPTVLIDIFISMLNIVFPVTGYIKMSVEEAYIAGVYIGILCEWFNSFINHFLADEEQKVFVLGGNIFTILTISMLSTALNGNMASSLINFLVILWMGYNIIVIIVGFIKHGISFGAIRYTLKMVYINPILGGFFISLIRLALPMIIMIICILPLALIPIKVIQIIGIIAIVFMGYYIKQFSDNLVDKIDHNENAMLVRFVVACVIIAVEIILLKGYRLPEINLS